MGDTAPRKLAAILAADIAGYSRLMGQDEEATVRALASNRDIVRKTVGDHQGRVFGAAGDSFVAEFASPVQAVRCALAIQDHIARANENVPKDRRMQFRMGINLGDVIVDGDNLLGDGVNVAARLEGLAPPGGVCISATVHEQVRNRIDVPVRDLGRRTFKNIDKPVHVYSVGSVRARAHGRRAHGPGRFVVAGVAVAVVIVALGAFFLGGVSPPVADAAPVLVVYPFESIGDDKRLAPIGDGLRQDLMVSLNDADRRLRIIAVSSRSDPAEPPPDYVLDGSIRIAGDTVRITALLVEKNSGYQLWGGRFDRAAADDLTFQDEIAGKIAGSLAAKLADAQADRAQPPGVVTTIMQGLAVVGRFARDAASVPFDLYRRVVGSAPVVPATKLSAVSQSKVSS